MKLLAVALLLLPLSVCRAEVVNDFTVSCPGFFVTQNGVVSPPTKFKGHRYKQICQTLNDQIEFATFYDTENKIPVYSAYGFENPETKENCKRDEKWHVEPQLEQELEDRNMVRETEWGITAFQAASSDYRESDFHRGHLIPVSIAHNQNCADATFTLTNTAPQDPSFNTGVWRVAEAEMVYLIMNDCKGMRVYVVTGVVPGLNTLNNRVQIPSHFWSAFCCFAHNKAIHSGAYIGRNTKGSTVERRRVQDLEGDLTVLYQNQLNNNRPLYTHYHNIHPNPYNTRNNNRRHKTSGFTVFGGECYERLIPEKLNARRRICKKNKDTRKDTKNWERDSVDGRLSSKE